MLEHTQLGLRRIGVVLLVVLATVTALIAADPAMARHERTITFEGLYPSVTWDELAAAADAVVEVAVVGPPTSRWNSRDGQEWKSDDPFARPLVHSYWPVVIDRVHSGTLSPGELDVRLPGGTVGDVLMVIDHAPVLAKGDQVLMLLDYRKWPVEGGYEYGWSPHWMNRGVFRASEGGEWRNDDAGIVVTADEFRHAMTTRSDGSEE